MEEMKGPNPVGELAKLALDGLKEALTIFDPLGTMLYYNRRAAEILDRKPEYLGTKIHAHHQAATNRKFGAMLQEFQEGRTEPFRYESRPYGQTLLVTVMPLRQEGRWVGCVQAVRLKEETAGLL